MSKDAGLYIRNIIFGMTDSLVSTVGLLAGIDSVGTTRHIIIATGIIYALVEGFSMAVGSFLSEESAEEYAVKKQVDLTDSASGAVVMFVSFVVASFVPLAPYVFFNPAYALWWSLGFSIVALFIVGIISAKISKVSILKRGVTMAALGASAIVIGVLVGKFMKI